VQFKISVDHPLYKDPHDNNPQSGVIKRSRELSWIFRLKRLASVVPVLVHPQFIGLFYVGHFVANDESKMSQAGHENAGSDES
jgi:hypothetical protein